MKNVLNYSKYLIISSISLILIGLFIIFNYGFKLSIEYTGGSVIDISKIEIDVSKEKENLKSFFEKEKIEFISIDESTEYLIIKFKESDSSKILEVKEKITSQFPNLKIVNVETIGSTFGLEFFKNSVLAIVLSLLGILAIVTYSFWNLQDKIYSYHFGIGAIVAMLHDVLIVISTFSFLGYYYNVELDGLFLTAILTVIGFSINDTIVVYDRIRENLNKFGSDLSIEEVANHSIFETLNRSLVTSFVVIFIMFSLFLLGGESIRYFSLALVIGITAGTYSSIFIATPFVIFLNKRFTKSK